MDAPIRHSSVLLARMATLTIATLVLAPGVAVGAVVRPVMGTGGPLDAITPRTAGDMLPYLRMASLRDFRVETLDDGSKRLRVTTTAVNVGEGQFELRASRPDTSQQVMHIEQRIFNEAGWTQYIDTEATMRYAGDGHGHWHVQEFNTLELYRTCTPTVAWRLNKIGFCLIDSVPYRTTLPGYPRRGATTAARAAARRARCRCGRGSRSAGATSIRRTSCASGSGCLGTSPLARIGCVPPSTRCTSSGSCTRATTTCGTTCTSTRQRALCARWARAGRGAARALPQHRLGSTHRPKAPRSADRSAPRVPSQSPARSPACRARTSGRHGPAVQRGDRHCRLTGIRRGWQRPSRMPRAHGGAHGHGPRSAPDSPDR